MPIPKTIMYRNKRYKFMITYPTRQEAVEASRDILTDNGHVKIVHTPLNYRGKYKWALYVREW